MGASRVMGRAPLGVATLVGACLVMGAAWRAEVTRTSDVSLEIGNLAPGDSIVITLEVDIDSLLPFDSGVYELFSQGTVTGDNFDPVATDDPDTPASNDPTITIVTHDSIPTPVVVSDFAAASSERGVTLAWTLASAHVPRLTGILVQRAESMMGPHTTRTHVPLQPLVDGRFTDPEVRVGTAYWYRLVLVRSETEHEFTGSLRVRFEGVQLRTQLDAPLAEPGNLIRIGYTIGSAGGSDMKLEIFDVAGRRVRVLEARFRTPGRYRSIWDRHDQSGRPAAQGLYFVRLRAHGQVFSRKVLVLQ